MRRGFDAIEAMCWQTFAPVLPDALALSARTPALSTGVARVGDPDATRTVYASVVILALLGVVLAVLAIWVFRRTRPDPELLGPLETMQTRRWRKLDPAAQRRSLDESRPSGAVPLRREASAPPVDSSFATVAPVESFDDLSDGADASEDGVDAEQVAADPVHADVTTSQDRLDGADDGDDDGAADDQDQAADGSEMTDSNGSPEDGPDPADVSEAEVATGDGAGVEASTASGEVGDDDDTGEIEDGFGFDEPAEAADLDSGVIDPPDSGMTVPIDPLLAPRPVSPDPSA